MAVNQKSIKFVKNVNARGKGVLAYGQYQLGAEFSLEFGKHPGAERFSKGDIVLLYQTLEGRGLLLTHLARIDDDKILENAEEKDYPFFLRATVVGKIPDGVERDVTSLSDALNFKGLALSGNLVALENAIAEPMKSMISVDEVQKRIVAIFRREGVVEE